MKKLFVLFISTLSITSLSAQRPSGPPPGGGLETMIAREKQAIKEKITDLTSDQELLIDGIYDEFSNTLKETFKEPASREERREKITALRSEKDELIKDVLNEEQYAIYESISRRRKERK